MSQTENSFEIELLPKADWAYFHGHFPGMPVLPGYAITEICKALTEFCFKKKFSLSQIYSLRMKQPVSPGDQIKITLSKNANENRFQLHWQSRNNDNATIASIDFELA